MLLITGSAGFAGNHLKQELNKKNIAFVEYDLQNGQDIRNKFQLETIFANEQIKKVIHLAARTGVGTSKEFPDVRPNQRMDRAKNQRIAIHSDAVFKPDQEDSFQPLRRDRQEYQAENPGNKLKPYRLGERKALSPLV